MSTLARQSNETLVTQVAALAMGLVGGVLAARFLGPEGKGLYTWLLLWPALLVAGGRFGLDAAAAHFGRADPASRPVLRRWIAPLAFGLGTVIAAILFVVAPRLADSHGAEGSTLLALSLSVGPFALFTALVGGLLLGSDRVRAFNLLTLLSPVIYNATLLTVCLVDPARLSVSLIVSVWAASQGLAALAAYRLSRGEGPAQNEPAAWAGRFSHREAPTLPARSGFIKQALGYGLRVHLGGLAAHLNMRLMHFVIGAIAGTAGLGIYSVAMTAAELPAYVASAESLVLLPAASGTQACRRWPLVTRRTLRTLALFAGICLAGVFLIRPAVQLLFGPAFAGVVPVFYLLLPGMMAHSVNLIVGTGLRASAEPMAPTRAAWIGLLVIAALAPLLISRWGLAGGALTFSIGQVVSCAALLRYARSSRNRVRAASAGPQFVPATRERSHAIR